MHGPESNRNHMFDELSSKLMHTTAGADSEHKLQQAMKAHLFIRRDPPPGLIQMDQTVVHIR